MWGEVETMNDVNFVVDMQSFSTIAPKSNKKEVLTESIALRSKIHMDIETLKMLTNYCNWIPLMRGLHLGFIESTFPGWEWNDFVPKLIKKKILQFGGEAKSGLTALSQGFFISSDIEAIEFKPYKSGVKIDLKLKSEEEVK